MIFLLVCLLVGYLVYFGWCIVSPFLPSLTVRWGLFCLDLSQGKWGCGEWRKVVGCSLNWSSLTGTMPTSKARGSLCDKKVIVRYRAACWALRAKIFTWAVRVSNETVERMVVAEVPLRGHDIKESGAAVQRAVRYLKPAKPGRFYIAQQAVLAGFQVDLICATVFSQRMTSFY